MSKFYKISLIVCLTLGLTQNAYAFDLKSLTDKIQKDIGSKLNVPNNTGSNPLGGMLKGLSQNKGNISANTVESNSSSSNGNTKLAKGICESNIPQTIKNLPQGNNVDVENDFGKKQSEIIKIINTIPNGNNDPYVSSLKTFEGAFETKEIEILFNNFIKKRNIKDLATIKAISAMQVGFSKNKKQLKANSLLLTRCWWK